MYTGTKLVLQVEHVLGNPMGLSIFVTRNILMVYKTYMLVSEKDTETHCM